MYNFYFQYRFYQMHIINDMSVNISCGFCLLFNAFICCILANVPSQSMRIMFNVVLYVCLTYFVRTNILFVLFQSIFQIIPCKFVGFLFALLLNYQFRFEEQLIFVLQYLCSVIV